MTRLESRGEGLTGIMLATHGNTHKESYHYAEPCQNGAIEIPYIYTMNIKMIKWL